MSAAPVIEQAEMAVPDPAVQWLGGVLSRLGAMDPDPDPAGEDADRIDRIALCERLQAGLEAVKATEMVAFARSQAAEQSRLGVHPRRIERGIADQIALACRASPPEGDPPVARGAGSGAGHARHDRSVVPGPDRRLDGSVGGRAGLAPGPHRAAHRRRPDHPGQRGVCERGNYVRELPGWTVRLVDPDTHTVVTTPTGHRYLSRPLEPP